MNRKTMIGEKRVSNNMECLNIGWTDTKFRDYQFSNFLQDMVEFLFSLEISRLQCNF